MKWPPSHIELPDRAHAQSRFGAQYRDEGVIFGPCVRTVDEGTIEPPTGPGCCGKKKHTGAIKTRDEGIIV
ncbi:MAG: hypothetical protein AAGJ87_06140 [Pseudomonadota bacterium]